MILTPQGVHLQRDPCLYLGLPLDDNLHNLYHHNLHDLCYHDPSCSSESKLIRRMRNDIGVGVEYWGLTETLENPTQRREFFTS